MAKKTNRKPVVDESHLGEMWTLVEVEDGHTKPVLTTFNSLDLLLAHANKHVDIEELQASDDYAGVLTPDRKLIDLVPKLVLDDSSPPTPSTKEETNG